MVSSHIKLQMESMYDCHETSCRISKHTIEYFIILLESGFSLKHINFSSSREHPRVVQIHKVSIQVYTLISLSLVILFGNRVHVELTTHCFIHKFKRIDLRWVGKSIGLVQVIQASDSELNLGFGIFLVNESKYKYS